MITLPGNNNREDASSYKFRKHVASREKGRHTRAALRSAAAGVRVCAIGYHVHNPGVHRDLAS